MASESLNELLNLLLPQAEQFLIKYGEFFPFAAQINVTGELGLVAGAPTNEDRPQSQKVIDLFLESMRSAAGRNEITAYGICHDSRFRLNADSEPQDAICCRLESAQGESLELYLPYNIKTSLFGKKRTVTLGELVALAKETHVWVGS